MSIFKLFFSCKGRINRPLWWTGSMALAIVKLGLAALIAMLFPALGVAPVAAQGQITSQADGLAQLLVLYPMIAVSIKRLHDRDKSGWWIAALMAPAFVFAITFGVVAAGGGLGNPGPMLGILLLLGGLTLIAIVWNFVELGFLNGTHGHNPYGRPWKLTDMVNGETDAEGSAAIPRPAAAAVATPAGPIAARKMATTTVKLTPPPMGFGKRPVRGR